MAENNVTLNGHRTVKKQKQCLMSCKMKGCMLQYNITFVDVSGFGNQELDEPKHCLPVDMRHEQRAMNSERCNVIGRMPSHGMQMRNEEKHAI